MAVLRWAIVLAAVATPTEVHSALPEALYFRQLQAGGDIAAATTNPLHSMARNMNNFVYVVGDRDTREAVLIDGCWDLGECRKSCHAAKQVCLYGDLCSVGRGDLCRRRG
jgi:hypothetical protein